MGQTVASLTARLASIDAAIEKAETAQSMGSDGTNVQRATLETLYKERRLVQRELDQASSDNSTGQSRMLSRTRVTGLGSILS